MYRKCTKICKLDTYANIYQNIFKMYQNILKMYQTCKNTNYRGSILCKCSVWARLMQGTSRLDLLRSYSVCFLSTHSEAYHRFIKIVQCTDFNLSEGSYFIVLRIVINFLKH